LTLWTWSKVVRRLALAADLPRFYEVLDTIAPGPLVTLSRAVAVAHVHGPTAALALVGTLDGDDRLAHAHRLEAVRAHLLEQAGNPAAAHDAYQRAARATASRPEQLYLTMRAAHLRPTLKNTTLDEVSTVEE
jgi:predicted RNA polymerase sigma factor